jgi:hypothetical protein
MSGNPEAQKHGIANHSPCLLLVLRASESWGDGLASTGIQLPAKENGGPSASKMLPLNALCKFHASIFHDFMYCVMISWGKAIQCIRVPYDKHLHIHDAMVPDNGPHPEGGEVRT